MLVINVSAQTADREPAQPEDLAAWAEWHGGGWLDLADSEESWVAVWQNTTSDYFFAQSYTVIGTDGLVAYRQDGAQRTTLEELIEAVQAAP